MKVSLNAHTLTVDLTDGRTISVPVLWFPRLAQASAKERANWRLIGDGQGIHWPAVDEDISVSNLLAGQPSMESPQSFKKWLSSREKAPSKPARKMKPAGR